MKALVSMYHDVIKEDNYNESGFLGIGADRYKYTIEEFSAHIKAIEQFLRNKPISAFELLSGKFQEIPYMITFDDGGISSYSIVADLLDELNWKGHFFISTDYINKNGFMTDSQISDLDRRGHIIGSHSCSHPKNISTLSYPEMLQEWHGSIDRLSALLNKPIEIASIPGGYYSKKVAKSASDCGIKILMTSEPQRTIKNMDNTLIIGRYTMYNYKTPDFAKKITENSFTPLLKEYVFWNLKKAGKKVLGEKFALLRKIILERNK
jgi:peptidoglycan/xylan/chitin deacetylase (PgdA/CDA1 family)